MSHKQVGIKTIAWFDENDLPVMLHTSALPDQDAILKAFMGQKTETVEVNDNSIKTVVIPEKKPSSENVPLQSMERNALLVVAAKLGIEGVDGRTSKPNIIAAIRKNANESIED